MKELTIKWDKLAKAELKKIYSYFKKKSVQGAENVRDNILSETSKLKNPQVNYVIDPDLGKPYRFIMVRNRYRVIYRRNDTEVRVVFVFDTKQSRSKLEKVKAGE